MRYREPAKMFLNKNTLNWLDSNLKKYFRSMRGFPKWNVVRRWTHTKIPYTHAFKSGLFILTILSKQK